jgi:aryl-alcohol dehydrogenase-like predicted oxidoreductase
MIKKIGLGTASLTSIGSYKESINLLNVAYDMGIRHIDTAPLYGSGYAEIIVGDFLKNKRDDIFVTTKFGLDGSKIVLKNLTRQFLWLNKLKKSYFSKNNEQNVTVLNVEYRLITKDYVEKSLITSLRRLNTDCIDAFLLHEALPNFLTEDALTFLSKSKEKGDVKYLGIGTSIDYVLDNKFIDNDIFDIYQYQGSDVNKNELMYSKFQNRIHFQHSIFSSIIKDAENINYSSHLKNALKNNINGKMIFSTRSVENLKLNLKDILQ